MLRWIVRIAIETGRRSCEINSSRMRQVDLAKRIVLLTHTKTRRAPVELSRSARTRAGQLAISNTTLVMSERRRQVSEMLGNVITRYQHRSIETAQMMEQPIEMARQFRKTASLVSAVGLNEDEVRFCEPVASNESAVRERADETLKKFVQELSASQHQCRLVTARKHTSQVTADGQAHSAQIQAPAGRGRCDRRTRASASGIDWRKLRAFVFVGCNPAIHKPRALTDLPPQRRRLPGTVGTPANQAVTAEEASLLSGVHQWMRRRSQPYSAVSVKESASVTLRLPHSLQGNASYETVLQPPIRCPPAAGLEARSRPLDRRMNPDSLSQLIKNCRAKKNRTVGRPPDRPSDWCPHKVQNPDAPQGFMFTDESAWCLIADKLESGHAFDIIELDKPAGAKAIVMQLLIPGQVKRLYVKVEVGRACCPIGRSFHVSYI